MLTDMILVTPARELRRAFAGWAVDQDPKVRTASSLEFAVPAALFTTIPEALLIGSTVDGHRYVSPDEDAAGGMVLVGEDGPETVVPLAPGSVLVGVATDEGFRPPIEPMREAVPGEELPPVPDEAYGPDAVELDEAPAIEPDDKTCPACGRTFSSSRGRDTHQRQAHPDTEVN